MASLSSLPPSPAAVAAAVAVAMDCGACSGTASVRGCLAVDEVRIFGDIIGSFLSSSPAAAIATAAALSPQQSTPSPPLLALPLPSSETPVSLSTDLSDPLDFAFACEKFLHFQSIVCAPPCCILSFGGGVSTPFRSRLPRRSPSLSSSPLSCPPILVAGRLIIPKVASSCSMYREFPILATDTFPAAGEAYCSSESILGTPPPGPLPSP
mmetsp:Transcript_22328/g.44817  ORF Transcript_22328/g.44817 Transcript_22328/m.44817 type:complete len:210 (-) Transcript_22328:839-1468(-)